MLVDAYDKSPRVHGHKVATIRLTRDPYLEMLEDRSLVRCTGAKASPGSPRTASANS